MKDVLIVLSFAACAVFAALSVVLHAASRPTPLDGDGVAFSVPREVGRLPPSDLPKEAERSQPVTTPADLKGID